MCLNATVLNLMRKSVEADMINEFCAISIVACKRWNTYTRTVQRFQVCLTTTCALCWLLCIRSTAKAFHSAEAAALLRPGAANDEQAETLVRLLARQAQGAYGAKDDSLRYVYGIESNGSTYIGRTAALHVPSRGKPIGGMAISFFSTHSFISTARCWKRIR